MRIARLTRTRGIRGELVAFGLGSSRERFQSLSEVVLVGPEAEDGARVQVEKVWEHQDRLIFKFHGVDSISAAEGLAGLDVCLPLQARPEAPGGEFYQSDLAGCEVIEKSSGERLGLVTEFREYGGPGLLEVEGSAGVLLIPFARSICVEIDVVARRIMVDLPDGLKELDQS